MHPFRFFATVDENLSLAGIVAATQKAEAVGCSALLLPDHLVEQDGALPVLAMIAARTERLRVGTFVLNVCLRHPAVLAQDLATIDRLSGGRLQIGMGAGWNKPNTTRSAFPLNQSTSGSSA